MILSGLCARVNPPPGQKSTRATWWHPINLHGEPPRPFAYHFPLQFENFDTSVLNQACNACFQHTKSVCAHREPSLLNHPLAEIRHDFTLHSLCENMSRLCAPCFHDITREWNIREHRQTLPLNVLVSGILLRALGKNSCAGICSTCHVI